LRFLYANQQKMATSMQAQLASPLSTVIPSPPGVPGGAAIALAGSTWDFANPNRTLTFVGVSPTVVTLEFSNTSTGANGQLAITNNDTVNHLVRLPAMTAYVVYEPNGNNTKDILIAPGQTRTIQAYFTPEVCNLYVDFTGFTPTPEVFPAPRTPSSAAFVPLVSANFDLASPNRNLMLVSSSGAVLPLTYSNSAVGVVGQMYVNNADDVNHTIQFPADSIYHVYYNTTSPNPKLLVVAPRQQFRVQIDYRPTQANIFIYPLAFNTDPNYGGPGRQPVSAAAFVSQTSGDLDMGSPNRTWTITDAYPLTVEMSYSNTAFGQVGQQRIRNAGASTRQLHLPTLAAYVVWSNTGSTEKYLPLPPDGEIDIQIDFREAVANVYVTYM
jgi:hypothetical protein